MILRLNSSKLQMSSCGLPRGKSEASKYPSSPRGSIKVTAARSRRERLEDSVERKCLQKHDEVRLAICRTCGHVWMSEFLEDKASDMGRFNPYGVTHLVREVTVGFPERQHLKSHVPEIVRQQSSWAMEKKPSQTDAECRGQQTAVTVSSRPV